MATVYLALGSNVGDSQQYIEQAVAALGGVLNDLKQASIYRSKAVGYIDQPDFLNTAISGKTNLSPEELLAVIQDIEDKLGRTPTFHWGPREIDIDLIFYGDQMLQTDQLTVPHPHFRERDFVLRPLADLNPKLVDPVSHQTMQQLLERLGPKQRTIKDS